MVTADKVIPPVKEEEPEVPEVQDVTLVSVVQMVEMVVTAPLLMEEPVKVPQQEPLALQMRHYMLEAAVQNKLLEELEEEAALILKTVKPIRAEEAVVPKMSL